MRHPVIERHPHAEVPRYPSTGRGPRISRLEYEDIYGERAEDFAQPWEHARPCDSEGCELPAEAGSRWCPEHDEGGEV